MTTLGILREPPCRRRDFYSGTDRRRGAVVKQMRDALGLRRAKRLERRRHGAVPSLFQQIDHGRTGQSRGGRLERRRQLCRRYRHQPHQHRTATPSIIVIRRGLAAGDAVAIWRANYRESEWPDKPKGRFDDNFRTCPRVRREESTVPGCGRTGRESDKVLKKIDPNSLDTATRKRLERY